MPLASCLAVALTAGLGCSSSNNAQPATSTEAAVNGPPDDHCTMNDMPIKQAIGMCVQEKSGALAADDDSGVLDAGTDGAGAPADAASDDSGASGGDGGASSDDAGAGADGGDNGVSDYGPTLYNAEGDDDDCKYHVTWRSTEVKENVGVTFYVNVIRRIDGQPATGADVQVEAFLSSHPTPTDNIQNTESSGGNYKVGPFVFDTPGKWTVRFHFYETCSDEPEDSPHGHAAFFINVP